MASYIDHLDGDLTNNGPENLRWITTTYDPPEIPIRCFDWYATFADGTDLKGWGETEAEAIADLIDKRAGAAKIRSNRANVD